MSQAPVTFDTICFDCDSTLSRIEGIDELAARAGVFDEIAPLTNAAMDGGIPLNEIYGQRLELVRPDSAALEWLSKRYVDEMVPGAREAIVALKSLGKNVHIISGGLRLSILPLAKLLGIDVTCVHAVDIYFDAAGQYDGFERESPLVGPVGKATVCARIKGDGTIAMVGDGLTDVAARGGGAFVVGFGGVVRRDVVAQQADCFIQAADLSATLDVLLNPQERTNLDNSTKS